MKFYRKSSFLGGILLGLVLINEKTEARENERSLIGETWRKEEKMPKSKKEQKNLFNAKTTTLSNGLVVVVVEDHAVPRVSIGLLYHVGSCDDPESLFGLSHMTEHMFFHGSKKYPNIDVTVGNLGGYVNACTSEDFTMYISDCPAESINTIFDIEADRMANFCLKDDKIFKKEQMAVYEERLMRVENLPLGIASEYIMASLSPQHPYGRDIGGMRHNIIAYSRAAIMDHYKKFYKPNNATLIVIGDVQATRVFEDAERFFGGIPRGSVPKRKRPENALQKDIYHEITYYSDKVASNKVDFIYNTPHQSTCDLIKIYALYIGLDALFDGVVYQFSRYFIDKKSLVYGLYCNYQASLDPRPLTISAALMPKVSLERFKKEFNKKIKNVLKNGLTHKEFERAKKNYLTNMVYRARDGHDKIRFAFANLALGFKINQIELIPEILNSITYEQTHEALKEVFSVKPFGVVCFIPKEKAGIKE